MNNINSIECNLLAVKYLLNLQIFEGYPANFILVVPKKGIFEIDEYNKEVKEYLIKYNNPHTIKIFMNHLELAEEILNIYLTGYKNIPAKPPKLDWDSRYDIYCDFGNNTTFPFEDLLLVKKRNNDILIGNKNLDNNRFWHPNIFAIDKKFDQYAAKILKIEDLVNFVYKIYQILSDCLNISEDDEKEDYSPELFIPELKKPLFDMDIVGQVYKICNGKQFNEIDQQNFYDAINNPSSHSGILQIRHREKSRVYYLIGQLENYINNIEWGKEMCESLQLSYHTYIKKRKAIVDECKDCNYETTNSIFIEDINKISP